MSAVQAIVVVPVLLLVGCVSPPSEQDLAVASSAASPSASVGGVLSGGAVDRTAFARVARVASASVLRVRNGGCEGVATGSGFAVAEHKLVTNRHVVSGAQSLTVETADGRSVDVAIAEVASDEDLAVVTTRESLPRPLPLAAGLPSGGDLVAVLGFPLGGPLATAIGRVNEVSDGEPYGASGVLISTSAAVRHGNSGGPLIDTAGKVVGIVFAVDLQESQGLAIPVGRLQHIMTGTSLHRLPSCEDEG